jgi:putative selenium metabolism hydrolase
MNIEEIVQELNKRVTESEKEILEFFREIVAIPSMNSDIEKVGLRVGEEMTKLGFDTVYIDRYGSIVGRVGTGDKVLLYDSHLDTVGIGDPDQWQWDPFQGHVDEEGNFFALGALDEKGSTPGMVYGIAMARDLGLLDDFTVYYLGNIEEWCDGVACKAFLEWENVRPDFVVVGEPTKMEIYRGHKGRIELEVVAKGISAHAASNYMGDNAVYKMLPVLAGIRDMDAHLPSDDFLGQGRVTVTDVSNISPSKNAVPDECRIFIDRRMTFGETKKSVIAAINELIPKENKDDFEIVELIYDEPSHTGAILFYEKYFPAWALSEDHPFVEAGKRTRHSIWGQNGAAGKWDFSTNGNYWCGKMGIPSIGFGPGNEIYAHTVDEHVALKDVVEATKFYALLPLMLKQSLNGGF